MTPIIKERTKKITQADIDANFDKLQKNLDEMRINLNLSHEKAKEEIESIRLAHRETEKTLNKAIGNLSNTLGSLVEHIMTPALPRKFKQFGYIFDGIVTVKWASGKGSIYTEIDGLLENKKQAVAVEVKTTLRRKDVDDHLQRMERVRMYADNHGDSRSFLGAIAGAIIDRDTKKYALSKGFFVIEPSGEDVKVTKPDADPRMW